MPELTVNGTTLYYEETGSGPQTVVFMHGLLMSTHLFDAQVAALSGSYRCIAFDFRGQGRSAVAATGYDMETLALDAAALIERLGGAPVHLAGLSMGGFVAMRVAARRPELVRSVMLLDTSADPEPPENLGRYKVMGFVGRWFGFGLVVSRIMPIMFGRSFLADPARAADRDLWRGRLTNNNRRGTFMALGGVFTRASATDELDRITAPTLVLVGDEDVATVPAKSEALRDAIAGAKLTVIPGAGHSSPVEQPEAVTAAIAGFLASVA